MEWVADFWVVLIGLLFLGYYGFLCTSCTRGDGSQPVFSPRL